MGLSFDFLVFLLEKIYLSINFWLPVIGFIHLAIILVIKKRTWAFIFAFLGLFSWVFIGHPLIESIQNASIDSIIELRVIDSREGIYWLYTNIMSTLPDLNYIILWSALSLIYGIFWTLLHIFVINTKHFNLYNLVTKLTIVFFILGLPLIVILEKRVTLEISIDQLNVTTEAFNKDNEFLSVRSDDSGMPIFLYIGESTSSMHMQVYGYPRNTNPQLKAFIKNNNANFIKVPNVWSTHTHTIPSLLDAFSIQTESPKENNITSIFQRTSYPIIPLLNKVDINTHIIANHVHEDFLSLVFRDAETLKVPVIKWGSIDPYKELKRFDHEVLKEALKITSPSIEDKKELFIFHSYAGHGDYKEFIPDKFHNKVDNFLTGISAKAIMGNIPFKDINSIESYDSAISYIDSNIVTALNFIKEVDRPMVFIYFPDHGESVYTRRGHDSSKFVTEMSQVPLFVYFNDQAIKKDLKEFKKIKERLGSNKFATLAQIPDLISEVMGVKIFDERRSKSLVSCSVGAEGCQERFIVIREIIPNRSLVKTDQIKNLSETLNSKSIVRTKIEKNIEMNLIDSTDSATDHYNLLRHLDQKTQSKICYHRSNSIAKAIRGLSVTNCLEFDVVVNNNDIDIYHPPAKNTEFKLDKMLDLVNQRKVSLWIDGKNIQDIKNCNSLRKEISTIENTNINILIEFPTSLFDLENKPENCIQSIKKLGFSTSYYMPDIDRECADEVNQGKEINKSKKCRILNERISWILNSNYFTDISFDYKSYKTILKLDTAKKLKWNIWGIEIDQIKNLSLENFHLIIPKNKDPNYN
jgi:glucan phosphoethanolaminetransferase (alkaline phosphatase superfamily)